VRRHDEGYGNGFDDEPVSGFDTGEPTGEAYQWYRRGVELLETGDPDGATQALGRAAAKAPASRSVREALARANFDAEHYEEAAVDFQSLAESDPEDDYAQFGWGLAAARLGQLEAAVEHLAQAAAMRPDVRHYATALRGARATLREHARRSS
jgi:tetratricopeptide (TPR) repeat protein